MSSYVPSLIIRHKGVLSHFLISHFRRQTESPHNATAMFRCQALLIREAECDPRQGKELSRTLSNFHASSSNYYNSEILLNSECSKPRWLRDFYRTYCWSSVECQNCVLQEYSQSVKLSPFKPWRNKWAIDVQLRSFWTAALQTGEFWDSNIGLITSAEDPPPVSNE